MEKSYRNLTKHTHAYYYSVTVFAITYRQYPCNYVTYPSRMNHALGNAGCAGGVHEEERMIKWQLFKLQLRDTMFCLAQFNKVGQHNSTHNMAVLVYFHI